jgi:hypothetical protein
VDAYYIFIVVGFAFMLGVAFYSIKTILRRARKKNHYSYWSIGYQYTSHPFQLDPAIARIYDRDQVPIAAETLADPFLFRHHDTLYLFYEITLPSDPAAKIAVSVYDPAHDKWIFQAIVLDEPFHLSYPYVFAHGADIFMIPESKAARSVRLYRATDFPLQWQLEKVLIHNKKFVDSSIVYRDQFFYLFTTRKRRLYLYYSDGLTSEWKAHPRSPIKYWNHARCGGRFFEHNGVLYRFAQEQAKGYGWGLHVFRVLKLSPTRYKEIPLGGKPLLEPFGDGWANSGMHHIDILQIDEKKYFSVFDGRHMSRKNTQPLHNK